MPSQKDVRHSTQLQRYQIGFRADKLGFTAPFVFPIFDTGGIVTGKYKKYDVGDSFQVINTRMKGKQKAAELKYDITESSFLTLEFAARDGWTGRDLRNAIGTAVRLPRKSAAIVADTMMLDWQREVDQKLTTGNITNNTTLAGAAQWNNVTSNPVDDIVTGIKTIEKAIGRPPNRVLIGGDVWWDGLQNNAQVVERVKATTVLAGIQQITPKLVGQLFDLEARVAKAIFRTSNEGQATVTIDYSLGKKVLIFFATPMPDEDTPHFGTTFVSQDFTTRRFFEPELGSGGTTWVQTEMERDTQIAFNKAAYLIESAVA